MADTSRRRSSAVQVRPLSLDATAAHSRSTDRLLPSANASGSSRSRACLLPAVSLSRRSASHALRVRYEQTGDLQALTEAVKTGRAAVAASDGDAEKVECLAALGNALLRLGEQTGDSAALAEAVKIYRTVADAPSQDDLVRARRLSNLALALGKQAQRESDPSLTGDALERAGSPSTCSQTTDTPLGRCC